MGIPLPIIRRVQKILPGTSRSFQASYDQVTNAILAPCTDVISFDIFDTLLVRPIVEPSDLFVLLEGKWRELGREDTFLDWRKHAERSAKLKLSTMGSDRTEPTLYAIYESFKELTGLSDQDVDSLC
ncbi:hypothetical protein, partial [Labrenzia sp. 011]|uniref:hypothetical protein n=1 Tax=Labrenzia sp. 011 TaxID=2171494 RepID=UPI00197BA53E